MVDVWSSTAVKLPRFMPQEHTTPYPMDEVPFLTLSADFGGVDIRSDPPTFGSPLLLQMIKLNKVLSHVNDFNRRCVEERLEGPALELGIQSLSLELERWMAALPYNMRDTPENFAWFASRGLGRIYAAVYLGECRFSFWRSPHRAIFGAAMRCCDGLVKLSNGAGGGRDDPTAASSSATRTRCLSHTPASQ